ncbi:type I polyketide synthase [Bradyrhizobium sp. HKCCYLRH3099]|uniref:type I polyketide synthase n=1 Tax=unclassified Bradyrhizobium TaxID=2631580 RepID=UPI003EB811E5
MTRRRAPIAIIGAGCRLPGGIADIDAYWDLLSTGRDAIGELPPGRWDNEALFDTDRRAAGRTYVRRGAFLDDVDGFDPEFFNINPREAASLDPQQRLLLEVAWEAVENAGVPVGSLRGSRTGVFVGIGQPQYAPRELYGADPTRIGPYSGTGALLCFASGRLSHELGLNGPSLSLDTACSSSLVALHLACQSLENRECDLALVAGVHLHLTPQVTLFLSRTGVLAPDGRSKVFSADADGFGRGEGCVVLVLRRLEDAGDDDVLGLVRGTAVNHDGPASGLTVPNAIAQEQVIRDALAAADVPPEAVGYVEAHGTGTRLGDPIELESLAAVFDTQQRISKLPLGSVKSSIGHLEAAAGLAGVLKTLLILDHQQVPPQPGVGTPNPDIPWGALPFTLPSRLDHPQQELRFAGISSFGMSGTNAHVIVERADRKPPADNGSLAHPSTLLMSAQSPHALTALAHAMREQLQHASDTEFAAICSSALRQRTPLRHRLAVIADRGDEARAALAAIASGATHPAVLQGESTRRRDGAVAFLFTGQGAQRPAMARALHGSEPVFRDSIERSIAVATREFDVPLRDLLLGDIDPTQLRRTGWAQPALFAFGLALAEQWRAWGVVPDIVLGHSLGEYTAACVAGAFSPDDGLRLVCRRAALMQSLPEGGAMAAVRADAARIAPLVQRYGGEVEITATNAPRSVTIAGPSRAIDDVVARCGRDGIAAQRLDVSHAFHSRAMEPILPALRDAVSEVRFAPPSIELIGNLTGGVVSGDEVPDPDRWCRHTREQVRFEESIRQLTERDVTAVIEIGPQPVLIGLGRQTLPDADILWLPSVAPGIADTRQMRHALAALTVDGLPTDLAASQPAAPRVRLPTTPFNRRPIRLPSSAEAAAPAPSRSHVIGRRLALPQAQGELRFETEIAGRDPFLIEHRVFGEVIVPAAWHLAMIFTALRTLSATGPLTLRDVTLVQAAHLPPQGIVMQLVLTPAGPGMHRIRLMSRRAEADPFDDDGWTTHVTGRAEQHAAAASLPVEHGRSALNAEALDGSEFYDDLIAQGFDLGRSFQWADAIRCDGRELTAELRRPAPLVDVADAAIHPGLLDSAFQLLSRFWDRRDADLAHLPFRIDQLRLWAQPIEGQLSCTAWRDDGTTATGNSPAASVQLTVGQAPVLVANGFVFRTASRRMLTGETTPVSIRAPARTPYPAAATAAAAPPTDRSRAAIERHLRELLGQVLGLADVDTITPRTRLFDLGLDSLAALELREDLGERLGHQLHATLLFDYPTIEALLDHLTGLFADPATPPASGITQTVSTTEIDDLSEEEAERLLRQELERLQ